jgi:hypothetical protein
MRVALIISQNAVRRVAIATTLVGAVVPVEVGCREGIYDMEQLHRGNIALVYLDACFLRDEDGQLSAPSHIKNICSRTTDGPFVIGACSTAGGDVCAGIFAELRRHGLHNSDKITVVPTDDNLYAAVRAELSASC